MSRVMLHFVWGHLSRKQTVNDVCWQNLTGGTGNGNVLNRQTSATAKVSFTSTSSGISQAYFLHIFELSHRLVRLLTQFMCNHPFTVSRVIWYAKNKSEITAWQVNVPTVKKVVTTAAVNSGGSGSGSEAARLVFFIYLCRLSLYFSQLPFR